MPEQLRKERPLLAGMVDDFRGVFKEIKNDTMNDLVGGPAGSAARFFVERRMQRRGLRRF